MQNIDISVVTPVFNEENNIEPFLNKIKEILIKLTNSYEIIFVMDPSSDRTEDIIKSHALEDKKIKLIKLSRRFGQPSATLAGIHNSSGNRIVVIDVDLQDPPEVIIEMNKKMDEGYEVVFAKRSSREGETFFKKKLSDFGYWLINSLTELNIPKDVGDFRMMSKKVVGHLKDLKEKHGFLRGLVSYVGFKQSEVIFNRLPRKNDKSKYNKFTGSLKIGLNGLICFSEKPLQILNLIGIVILTISFFLLLSMFFHSIRFFEIIILLLFGLVFLSMGITGEYISRIYEEVKDRPQFIIDEKINF
jgi:polyisoprenyl-phosphate glycosyltransferase